MKRAARVYLSEPMSGEDDDPWSVLLAMTRDGGPGATPEGPPSAPASPPRDAPLTGDVLRRVLEERLYITGSAAAEIWLCPCCLHLIVDDPDRPSEGSCMTCRGPICPRCFGEEDTPAECDRCGDTISCCSQCAGRYCAVRVTGGESHAEAAIRECPSGHYWCGECRPVKSDSPCRECPECGSVKVGDNSPCWRRGP